jgi:hypothetical protein
MYLYPLYVQLYLQDIDDITFHVFTAKIQPRVRTYDKVMIIGLSPSHQRVGTIKIYSTDFVFVPVRTVSRSCIHCRECVDPAFSGTSTCVQALNKNIKVVLQTQDSLLCVT